MGLLDDAIREHLELKRRRGADAVEISRLENEALGPVRRSPAGVPDLSETEAPETAATTATKDREPREGATAARPVGERDPAPPVSASESVPDRAASAADERPVYPAAAPEPTTILRPPPIEPIDLSKTARAEPDEPSPPDPAAEEPAPSLLSRFNPARRRQARGSAREVEPAREVPPAPYVPSPPDFDPEPYAAPPPVADEPDIEPAGDEPDVEDLLEETPEFLEETPEHDRLWFEQRPPRDFDFDG